MTELSIAFAFVAGLVSFLSPCVLPIIPGFLAYLAGSSLKESESKRKNIFFASLFFVLGFSVIFSTLGLILNTVLEKAAYDVQIWLSRIGGGFMILFGLYLTSLIKIPFLEKEYKLSLKRKFNSKHLISFIFGAAFAAGWTPCVGVVLGSILALAAITPGTAFALLLSYSFGLGIPFLLVGLFASRASKLINSYAHLVKHINIVFGIILILIGILAFTQNLNRIANFELLNRLLLQ